MSDAVVFISEERAKQLLDWDSTYNAMELALRSVSEKNVFQNPRSFTYIPNTKNILLSMPGYLENNGRSVLATKIVTIFPNNPKRANRPLPTIFADVFLFDTETGQLKCILEANEITAWRTAGASAVATNYLHSKIPGKKNEILSIIGAGVQGRIHAICLHKILRFKEVRFWDIVPEHTQKVVNELNGMNICASFMDTVDDCVKNADVIVTATYASKPLVHLSMVKPNVHINAIGAGVNSYSELSEDIYKNSIIYSDHNDGAKVELKGLLDKGLSIEEVGEVMVNNISPPGGDRITIFHSLGMAVEDAVISQILYEKHLSFSTASIPSTSSSSYRFRNIINIIISYIYKQLNKFKR